MIMLYVVVRQCSSGPAESDAGVIALLGGDTSQQESAAAAGGDLEVWRAPTFTKGNIPEEPPPPSLCV